MNFFSKLFGAKPTPKPTTAPATVTPDSISSSFGAEFAVPHSILRHSFDQVMATVELDANQREALFTAWSTANRSGNPSMEKTAATSILLGSGWRWPEYDRWSERFAAAEEWPYMWYHLQGLAEPDLPPPTTAAEAMSYLLVTTMTTIARERGILPKPAPRKRVELEVLLLAQVPTSALAEAARERYQTAAAVYREQRENSKCELLVHTLAMTAYALRSVQSLERLGCHGYQLTVLAAAGDAIEDRFAAKFNAGEITQLPPFFPGDRSCIQVTRRR